MEWIPWGAVLLAGVGGIVWGAETFAEHLGRAATRLGVGAFALALLLAGAEPEELATVVAASVRDAPGIAFGDIIGSNVTMCLVALGLGAFMTGGLPFTGRMFLYAAAALPVAALSVALSWDGRLSRPEGAVLAGLYVAYVVAIWAFERAPPVLGEVEELLEAEEELEAAGPGGPRGRIGWEIVLVFAGLAAMAVGASLVVEAVRRITGVEETQTKLGITVVGFATAFELVVLVWSASRRGATDVALAGVIGSFGYNVTMSLAAGALVKPIAINDASRLHWPSVTMVALFAGIVLVALPGRRLGRPAGAALLAAYPVFALAVILQ